jgi:hypothetical protein
LSDFEKSIGLRATPRVHWIDQHTGLQAFKFSTPFTTAVGKTHAMCTEQYKRNTILYVRAEFPTILTAQAVLRRVETILNPITSATEDIIMRTHALLDVLRSDTLTAKTLTGILAGSVATQVHGGSKEIAQAFLATNVEADAAAPAADAASADATASSSGGLPSATWTAAEQSRLRVAMRHFLDACVQGLEANKKLSNGTDSEREFQANLEAQFQELTNIIHVS